MPRLREVVEVVDPWILVSDAELDEAYRAGREREIAAETGRRNTEALRSCTLLVAYLEGQEIDSGTAAEVGFATALGIRCFGLRTDRRQAGEQGAAVNLQLESFITLSGGRIVTTLGELVEAVALAAESDR